MAETAEMVKISTEIQGAGENDTFNVTDRALEMINKVKQENGLSEDHMLRIGAQSGGCSGMSYALGFDENKADTDRLYDAKGQKIVVDQKSVFYLLGVTLDFVDGPDGSGFIFNNPNNFNTCGCQG